MKQLTVSFWNYIVVDFFMIGVSQIDALLSNIMGKVVCILKQFTVSFWNYVVVDFFKIGVSQIDALLSNMGKWCLDGPRRAKCFWTWAMLSPLFTIFGRPSQMCCRGRFQFIQKFWFTLFKV